MSGQLVRGVTIASNQSKNTLGSLLPQLVDLASFANFDSSNVNSTLSIHSKQATVPVPIKDGDFLINTTSNVLQVYYGATTSQKRWDAFGRGMSLINQSSNTLSHGSVVGWNSGTSWADLSYNNDCNSIITGVIGEQSVANGSFGLIKMCGKSMVKVSGQVNRGHYLTQGSNFRALGITSNSGNTTGKIFGIALTVGASNASGTTVMAYLFPYRN